jgi:tRNA dimethylallyltransferase
MSRPSVIAVFGPTAVGKTAVAIALAARLRAQGEEPVAVSADALQVYRGLETLTGAAGADEQKQLEHRLVGILAVTERFSVAAYARRAHAEIDGLLAAGRRPIVVGGTGLYLRAALADLDLRPRPPTAVLAAREEELARDGAADLHHRLMELAPWLEGTVAPTDRKRIVRSLALHDIGELRRREGDSQLWTDETRHPTLLVGLVSDREALNAAIERRIEGMVAAGVADEVRRADAAGASPTARAALGFVALLTGDVDVMVRDTRRYARRQLTWMRKLAGVTLVDVGGRSPDDVAAEIAALLARR